MNDFRQDVLTGLTDKPKHLPSRWFYDDRGSAIFQEIMEMPEYYLTDCELEILQSQSPAIWRTLAECYPERRINVVELGAGDGTKTRFLLQAGLAAQWDITYRPIDISAGIFPALQKNLPADLNYQPAVGTYQEQLGRCLSSDQPNLVLFLGSNLGNFRAAASDAFLKLIGSHLRTGDTFLLGADLQKDPHIILHAYDDPHGITARFNLNLLDRMNRELGTDFQRDRFRHYAIYDVEKGEARSYILSTVEQSVHVPGHSDPIAFGAWEAIHVEISRKYTRTQLATMFHQAGIRVVEGYTDRRRYFMDILGEKE